MLKMRKIYLACLSMGLLLAGMAGCKKDDKNYPNPYAGGKPMLGIQFSTDPPSPGSGPLGSEVFFKANGLLPFKDSMSFFMNSVKAKVLSMDSGGVKLEVPDNASTGVVSATVGDEIFFGPIFHVDGKIVFDSTFQATVGANNTITDMLQLKDERMVFVGGFTDFNHEGVGNPINRIVFTSKDGAVDKNANTDEGTDGYLSQVGVLPNGKLVIAGGFTSYNNFQGLIPNITLLNPDGSMDSTLVNTFLHRFIVPYFNGGTDGFISKALVHNNTITVIGSFNYYVRLKYDLSDYTHTRDSIAVDSVRAFNMIRLFADGSLDSSFNFDYQLHQGKKGPNGPVSDAFMQKDGKLIVVGRFSKYNDEPVNNIVRLNLDGSVDRTFKIGSGADNSIASIRYNEATGHFMLAGAFESFNGLTRSGLVMLNPDGTIVQSFRPEHKATGDFYSMAQQLSNGLIIVNGYFKEYKGVHRARFMVLDETGQLAEGYNTTGDFNGSVYKTMETKDGSGHTVVTLIGNFYKFDEVDVGNITRLIFK